MRRRGRAAVPLLQQRGAMPMPPPSHPPVGKVVDRHWYSRNKHIFPASHWTPFDEDAAFRGARWPPAGKQSVK